MYITIKKSGYNTYKCKTLAWNEEKLLDIHYIIAPDNEIKDLVYFKGEIGNTRIDLTSKRYTNGDEFEIYVSIIK